MKLRDKMRYKMGTWTYGKKSLNKNTSSLSKTFNDIDEVIDDVVKTIKKKK